MKLQRLLVSGALLFGLHYASLAHAELAIIVNSANSVDVISVEEVASIFLGKSHKLADGTRVVPLDQMESVVTKEEFYSKVVKKSLSQLNSYWSRLIFTGRGQPPVAVSNNSEVLELISSNPNMIGYVDVASLQTASGAANVKVLLTIQ